MFSVVLLKAVLMDFKTLLGIAALQELEQRRPMLRQQRAQCDAHKDVAERERAEAKKLGERC
jgi:hypothetical protein